MDAEQETRDLPKSEELMPKPDANPEEAPSNNPPDAASVEPFPNEEATDPPVEEAEAEDTEAQPETETAVEANAEPEAQPEEKAEKETEKTEGATPEEKPASKDAAATDAKKTNTSTSSKTKRKRKQQDETAKLKSEVEKLQKQVSDLQNQVAEQQDQYLRLRAEYQNYQNRTVKEKQKLYGDAKVDCITELLTVVDSFERALQTPCSDENYKKGIELTFNQVNKVFETLGITKIDALGQPFDPNYHNAIKQVDNSEYESDTVCEVYQNGYMLGDRLIRPAMVAVAV